MGYQLFTSAQFGDVRTVQDGEGRVLFCGADVAKSLGYKDSVNALKSHCKPDGVVKHHIIDSMGRRQQAKFISEGNLYRLIAHSKLPEAERFEKWIFEEVLPTIRRNGAYMTEKTLERALESPDFLIELATRLKTEQEERRRLEAQAAADRPKVLFADAVSVSKSSILIGDLAKILKQNGVEIGANRLFQWMRDNGYLISRKGSDYNSPTQRAMEMGLFAVKETVVTHSDGHTSISRTPKVTGKGQVYFVNKFLKGGNAFDEQQTE